MKIPTTLRLDEILDILESDTTLIEEYKKVYPLLEYFLNESINDQRFLDSDFPVEEVEKFIGKWDFHWSVAPNTLMTRQTKEMLEQVVYNPSIDLTKRLQKIEHFVKNMCNEESQVLFLILTRNLQSKYPNVISVLS